MAIYNAYNPNNDPLVARFNRIANIYNPTDITLLNNLISGARSDGYLSKFIAIWPVPTTNIWGNSFNIIDPTIGRLTFVGTGFTHGASGISTTGNSYIKTGLIATDYLTAIDNVHLSVYVDNSRVVSGVNSPDMGCNGGSNSISFNLTTRGILNRCSALMFNDTSGSVTYFGSSVGVSGYTIASRAPSIGQAFFMNAGTVLGTTGGSGGGIIPPWEIYLSGWNSSGTAANLGTAGRRWCMWTIGYGLTQAEAVQWSTRVQTYQVGKGRAV